jgi:hypothetical protein
LHQTQFLSKIFTIFAAMELQDFRNIPVRTSDFGDVYPHCREIPNKVLRLERDGMIVRLKRGLYVVSPKVSGRMLSTFLVANHLTEKPSYVSMQSALRHYGLIPEAVYATTSVTLGAAKVFENRLGTFSYVHADADYYPIGITVGEEAGVNYLVATPEKALCDLVAFTPRLNLRYLSEVRRFLQEDLRLDMELFHQMNVDAFRRCAALSRKKPMLRQIIKLMENGNDI